MQGMMGTYLEKNIHAFQDMQKTMQEQSKKLYGDSSRVPNEMWTQFMNLQGPAMQSMMQSYMEQSQRMFQQLQDQMQNQTRNMFAGFTFPGFPPPPGGKPPEEKK
jgi:polyhydroxyalkanoate synthesis regulator protein